MNNGNRKEAVVEDIAAQRLNPSVLCKQAEAATGLNDWGDTPFMGALEKLCASAVAEAKLSGPALDAFIGRILHALTNRLKIYADRAKYPEIAKQKIEKPMVVMGIARSGTTILHALLAQDPRVRSPQTWEVGAPCPPPRAETYESDPRIAGTQAAIDGLPQEFKSMHAMGATLPDECNSIMQMAFLSPNFGATANIPSYMSWLINEADVRPAYQLHKQVLQHLQAFTPREYWVLKAPPHLWWTDVLFETYPDARVVFTHRDPAQLMASNASLIGYLRGQTYPIDPLEVGRQEIEQWKTGVARSMAMRDAGKHEAQIIDTQYKDFIEEPMKVIRAIYQKFDIILSDSAIKNMESFLSNNKSGKHGKHVYSANTYGMNDDQLHIEFADYIKRFNIPVGHK